MMHCTCVYCEPAGSAGINKNPGRGMGEHRSCQISTDLWPAGVAEGMAVKATAVVLSWHGYIV